ncbi:hypothetical protein [Halostella salina]|uniref:hypothetical protein n=1 Tax=Halostella salina TaxID=1547897 RepID=UPI000EF7FA40|nr:hypothetical protein [Halostella salina]
MTPNVVIDDLKAVLQGGHGIQESEYREKRLSAALSLQGIACTDTAEAEKAWRVLSAAVTESDFRVALQAAQALAYVSGGRSADWQKVVGIYSEAVSSGDRLHRVAAVEGSRRAIELNPEVTADVVGILGDAAEKGLSHIVEKDAAADDMSDITDDMVRQERSAWKALAGLSEASRYDPEAVKQAVDEEVIQRFLNPSLLKPY